MSSAANMPRPGAGGPPYTRTAVWFSRERNPLAHPCEEYTPSTLDTYPFPNPLQHVNTVTMSELIIPTRSQDVSQVTVPGPSFKLGPLLVAGT